MIQWLGEGGNCVVYLVVALSGKHQGALFALKIFLRTDDTERLTQFRQEAEFLKACDHPAIMKVYDSGDVYIPSSAGKSEHPFIVADYFPETLDVAVYRGKVRVPQKVLFTMQLLSALQCLSSLSPPVVHRDIKPRNIFVRGHSCALGDFGLMRYLDGTGQENEPCSLFKKSEGLGMPHYYRTPELVAYAKGDAPLTLSSDIFQLGLVAAEMFCGANPLKKCKNSLDPVELESLRIVSGKHGVSIRELISRMLVTNPAKRESIAELLDPWEGILNDVARDYHDLEGRAF